MLVEVLVVTALRDISRFVDLVIRVLKRVLGRRSEKRKVKSEKFYVRVLRDSKLSARGC